MIHTHSITQKDVFLPSAAKKTSNSLAIRFQGRTALYSLAQRRAKRKEYRKDFLWLLSFLGTLVVLGWTMVGIPMLIAIAGGQG